MFKFYNLSLKIIILLTVMISVWRKSLRSCNPFLYLSQYCFCADEVDTRYAKLLLASPEEVLQKVNFAFELVFVLFKLISYKGKYSLRQSTYCRFESQLFSLVHILASWKRFIAISKYMYFSLQGQVVQSRIKLI